MTDSNPLQLRHTFGSIKRTGAWRVPAHVVVRQRLGSTELDLTSAVFDGPEVTLDLDVIGGSVELRVPDGVHVDAAVATRLASYRDRRHDDHAPGRRTLTLRGRVVWGSVELHGPSR